MKISNASIVTANIGAFFIGLFSRLFGMDITSVVDWALLFGITGIWMTACYFLPTLVYRLVQKYHPYRGF